MKDKKTIDYYTLNIKKYCNTENIKELITLLSELYELIKLNNHSDIDQKKTSFDNEILFSFFDRNIRGLILFTEINDIDLTVLQNIQRAIVLFQCIINLNKKDKSIVKKYIERMNFANDIIVDKIDHFQFLNKK